MTYTAFEVLEIAEQIERNGAKFYRAAAEVSYDVHVRDTCLRLAEWECRHEKIFARMKQGIAGADSESAASDSGAFLPEPKAMAGLAVFSMEPGHSGRTETDVLKMAVGKERDTVVFYKGLRNFVSAGADQDEIEVIIKEEMQHIEILERLLQKTE